MRTTKGGTMAVRFREHPDRQERKQSQAEEKLLPQNIDAEVGVLGSILIDPTILFDLEGILHPEDFYRESHRIEPVEQVTPDHC
jgi:hypothetical protein